MDKVLSAIFSASFLFSVIRITTPLMFGAMGALICKQGGVLHIAFEATMLFAAFFGMAASAFAHSLWVALLAGIAGGVIIMLLLGYFTLMLDANVGTRPQPVSFLTVAVVIGCVMYYNWLH